MNQYDDFTPKISFQLDKPLKYINHDKLHVLIEDAVIIQISKMNFFLFKIMSQMQNIFQQNCKLYFFRLIIAIQILTANLMNTLQSF